MQFAPMAMAAAGLHPAPPCSAPCIMLELRALPQPAHLSVLSELMSLFLLASGVWHTLACSEVMSIKIVKRLEKQINSPNEEPAAGAVEVALHNWPAASYSSTVTVLRSGKTRETTEPSSLIADNCDLL